MRTLFALILPTALLAACGSSGAAKVQLPEPGVGLEQEVGPAELNYPYGPIEVKYNLAVQNNADVPITLIRAEVGTVNPAGGAYSLRHEFYNFHEAIPPHATRVVTFWAKAFGWGRGARETEPVTVRITAHFDSAQGAFQKIFLRELSQYPD